MTESDSEDLSMGEGAVAIVDALGFREASKSPDGASGLVDAVRKTRRVTSDLAELNNLGGEAHVHYTAVSDTIMLAASTRGTLELNFTVASVAASVASLLATAVTTKLPLAYRGCLGAGKLLVAEEDLFVGQAIDEAAEWHERALAAVVWLTPRAAEAARQRYNGPLFMECELPVRDLGKVSVLAVNPFYVVANECLIRWPAPMDFDAMNQLHERLMAPFGRSRGLDVEFKRQNTETFLNAAKYQTRTEFDIWAKRRHEEFCS